MSSKNLLNTLYLNVSDKESRAHRILIDTVYSPVDDRRVPIVWVITPELLALRFHVAPYGLTEETITAMVKVWIDLECPVRSLHRPEEVWTQEELQ